MTTKELTGLYERDLRRLMDEISAFQNEENLWKTTGSIQNSTGNLALHLIGGMNFLIGTTLARSGYVRNREEEFTKKNIDRGIIIQQLEELVRLINDTVNPMTPAQMDARFPIFFDKEDATIRYVLTQLLAHLNYHLGQVNYLRRALEQ